jgi:hypothetical protein
MGSDLTSLTPRHPQPHVDPDLPSGRQHGYRDLLAAATVAPSSNCPAVDCGKTRQDGTHFCFTCWCALPQTVRRRLSSAGKAVAANPDSTEVAAIYQARFAEAVAYLGSGEQVAR